MSGYVTQSRFVRADPLKQTFGFVGDPARTTTASFSFPDLQQVTTSFRSSRTDPDPELQASARIFRNGFASNDPIYDRGHTFDTSRQWIVPNRSEHYFQYESGQYPRFYRGPLLPPVRDGAASYNGYAPPIKGVLTTNEIATYGGRAINATAPTAPQANASQFIGELFLGLPSMVGAAVWKEKTAVARSAGSEYLNIQFGWLPFIKDLMKIANSLKRATDILLQLERDNGRVVRRQFGFPRVQTTSEEALSQATQPHLGIPSMKYAAGRDPVRINTVTTRDVWFKGAFSYYVPMDSSMKAKLERYSSYANVLLGGRLSPDVLWELAPWSWLVDWKFGIGVTLSNATRFSEDGLVLRYGYLMCRDSTSMVAIAPPCKTDLGWEIPASQIQLRSERKARYRATPYGFGVNIGGLKDSQWAILAALGMTKGPRQLPGF